MQPPEGYEALRSTVAFGASDHVTTFRVLGRDALDALDPLVTGELFVREGRMLHTFVLSEAGAPLADAYVAVDAEGAYLMVEGLDAAEALALVAARVPKALDARFQSLAQTHRVLSIHGPFAWELVSRALTEDILGLSYLSFFEHDDVVCFRAGKTGEYGYDLLVTRERYDALEARVAALAEELAGARIGLPALDLAALENGFFSMRLGDVSRVTPFELQQQWRLTRTKAFAGRGEIDARLASSERRRLVHVVSESPIIEGDSVLAGDTLVGSIFAARYSPGAGSWLARALVDEPYSHPGIHALRAADSRAALVTRSAPVLQNRSLYVDPRKHSFATRDEIVFPTSAREAQA